MTAEDIIKIVCDVLVLDHTILTGKHFTKGGNPNLATRQTREYSEARHIATYLIRKHFETPVFTFKIKKRYGCTYTYQEIAKLLGSLLKDGTGDHAASIYAEISCRELMASKNKDFLEKYSKCEMEVLKKKVGEIPDNNFSKK